MISTSDGKETEKDLVDPPRKKLKQARLSFQKLSPSIDTTSPSNVKKRKISEDSGDEIKIVKVIKPNDEQSVSQEKNHVSDNTKIDNTSSPSECNIEDVCLTDSKSPENGHLDKRKQDKNKKLQNRLDIEVISDTLECKTEEAIDSENSETGKTHHEIEKQELKLAISENESSPRKIANEEKVISSKDLQVTENDSDSSESDSEVISDGDNELDETIDDHNSSGSCVDVTKEDDEDLNSSKNDPENERKAPHTPKNNLLSTEVTKKKKLTPKQLLQREEAAKRREEKEKERKEKEKRKTEEKERKRKEKEQRRKEKEEKEEQKRKEKEEKEKKKQAELEQKSEEKRLKEEEKRKKEEQRVLEKKKKDEKKLAEEEAKRKEEEVKKKEAAAFANFFVASKGVSKTTEEVEVKAAKHFMPFQVKADMRLAPVLRSNLDESRMETFDLVLKEQSSPDLYLNDLRKKSYVPGKSGRTWPLSDLREVIIIDEEDDVIPASSDNEVVESCSSISHPRAKLLMFSENRRPPYWGTWTKKSRNIRPTCPFNKDGAFFDYEVDSDDEWEEEEPGESLHGSDDEKESEDEYEVDNEFFVPHGYLSDEENCEEEETMNPETMKAKLKLMEMEFEEEMKHKTERIKPRLFGCFWTNENSNQVGARVLALLSSYGAVCQESPIVLSGPSTPEVSSPVHENQGARPSTGSKKKKFPESFVPALIKLIHGNINGRGFLVKEFSSYMKRELETAREESEKDSENNLPSANAVIVSKLKISEKIKQLASWIACPEEGPFLNRMCWYVPSEVRSAYGLEDLVIPNKVWNYINAPRRELELSNTIPSPIISDMNSRPKSLPLITKFTKKMSQEERQRQLAMAGSCGENEIESLDDVKVLPTSENNGKMSDEQKSEIVNSSLNDNVNSYVTPVKASIKTLSNGQKKSENSKIHEKLLQFKSKGSSIIPHLEQRKRVQILKSGPLGQAISPSTSKTCSSGPQETQTKGDKSGGNDVKNKSDMDDCIVID